MNRGDLRALFRAETLDQGDPPAFADADVHLWLDQAEEEAAVRADLLLEVDNAALCELTVTSGTSAYDLHAKVVRVQYASFLATDEAADSATELELIDRIELTRRVPSWRSDTGRPKFLLTENGKARLVPTPDVDGTATLEVYRMPLDGLATDAAEPEIRAHLHRDLVDWVMYRAFSRPDTETQDLERAAAALVRFEQRFGPRPDADGKQAAERLPQFNKAW